MDGDSLVCGPRNNVVMILVCDQISFSTFCCFSSEASELDPGKRKSHKQRLCRQPFPKIPAGTELSSALAGGTTGDEELTFETTLTRNLLFSENNGEISGNGASFFT